MIVKHKDNFKYEYEQIAELCKTAEEKFKEYELLAGNKNNYDIIFGCIIKEEHGYQAYVADSVSFPLAGASLKDAVNNFWNIVHYEDRYRVLISKWIKGV